MASRFGPGIQEELPGADAPRDAGRNPDVHDVNRAGVLGGHPLLRVVEGYGPFGPDRRARPEAARHIHAQDRLSGRVHVVDQGGIGLSQLPLHADSQERIDDQVGPGHRLLASVEPLEDGNVHEPLEVRPRFRRRELVGRAGEEDLHLGVLGQVACGDETIAAVVPRTADDEDPLPRRGELSAGDVGHALARRLHELEDRDAEVLRVAVEHAHLDGRDHRRGIQPSVVKHCPRGVNTRRGLPWPPWSFGPSALSLGPSSSPVSCP